MSKRVEAPRFDFADAERAHNEWGANCGPGAIAAICQLSLDELRPHMGDFEEKHYTNPALMWKVLRGLGVNFKVLESTARWPTYGLVRIQWEGPWTEPGVPIRARYRFTHWVGACTAGPDDIGIFDINCINNGTGWVSLDDWAQIIVPYLLESISRANGKWTKTHVVEVRI